MLKRPTVAAAFLALGLTLGGQAAVASASPFCTVAQLKMGTCPLQTGNDSVVIGGIRPGIDESSGGSSGEPRPPDSSASITTEPSWSLMPGFIRCWVDGQLQIRRLRCPDDSPDTTQIAQPTISDLASFKPQAPSIAGEPDGWALKGRPANFIAPVDAHVVAGTLLGRPADVRFTPVTWHWDFGDGASAGSTTGGSTWERLGVPRFSTTPTSHVYRDRGDFTVALSVEYRADYRYDGGGWNPIEGTLTVPVGSSPIRVFVGSTVLTDRGCDEASSSSC